MPLLTVTTNRPRSPDERREAVRHLSRVVAEVLGKSERYVMVSLQCNPDMLFAGNDAPLALLRLNSIGLPHERTTELSATLTDAVTGLLGVAADRVYIEFCDAERHLWGWNGGTF